MLENRIKSITIRNFRSLADVTVELDDLTVLVGPNASGKSNFLELFRFVRDVLNLGLKSALQMQTKPVGIQRISFGNQFPDVEIQMNLTLAGQGARYGFSFGSDEKHGIVLKSEFCDIGGQQYEIRADKVKSNSALLEAITPEFVQNLILKDSLILKLVVFFARLEPLRPLYEFLSNLRVYSLLPNAIVPAQYPDTSGGPLEEDGSNLASVLLDFSRDEYGSARDEVYRFLSDVVPGISLSNPIAIKEVGNQLLVTVKHSDGTGTFDLSSESDGTIRVLALLTALYQPKWLPLIGIEEPELMVHPGATGLLSDALFEISHRSQIILTTHSPDLISRFRAESLRIVERVNGETKIGKISEEQRQVINDQLFSGGDLLRIEGLRRGE